ncbi:nitroreductase family protein [Candidatus Saccharibacteria bacterium]|nr:nitroreductase family protein [Candidatus Saccharibacteria bacterium]MCL1962784.1 nitroreductase family protein [Candidatus Saccharibacteria bacterium]
MDEIYIRRSYHDGFSSLAVEDDKIKAILKAGMNAPSARNTQPWEFVVVKDRAMLEKLANSKSSGGAGACKTAAFAVIICADDRMLNSINTGLAAENMMLAAENLDVQSLTIDIWETTEAQINIKQWLNIPENLTAYVMIAFGYADEKIAPNDRFIEEKIHWEKF